MKAIKLLFVILICLNISVVASAATVSEDADAALKALQSVNVSGLSDIDKTQISYAKEKLLYIIVASNSKTSNNPPKCSIVGGVGFRHVLVQGKGYVKGDGDADTGECSFVRPIIEALIKSNQCVLQPTGVCGF